jgi:hypothetical protein
MNKWDGESAEELVAKDICPKCLGALDTGWECNKCGFDAAHLVRAEKRSQTSS